MKISLNYILFPMFFVAVAATSLTSCNNNDNEQTNTETVSQTIEEVEAEILGQWKSREMTLTFMPNKKVNIKHDEITRETIYESFYSAPRDDNEPYTIRKGNKCWEILIGDNDYYGYEYMYIYTINEKTLFIEFYGEGITFNLKKAGNIDNCTSCNGTGYSKCSNCDGNGGETITYDCSSCGGHGSLDDGFGGSDTCYSCNGSGIFGSDYNFCNSCYGTGQSEYGCSDCNGSGYVLK